MGSQPSIYRGRVRKNRANRATASSFAPQEDCTVHVVEVPDGVPALVGQISLEMLDLVVDLQSRRLIGNPAHGGDQILELY